MLKGSMIVLMWWFLLASPWDYTVVGPFSTQLQCNQFREALVAGKNHIHAYECVNSNER